jgi:hypothetical protein
MFFQGLRKVLIVIALFSTTFVFGEDWKITVQPDYFIEINNFWNHEPLIVDFQVESENNTVQFNGKVTIKSNEKKGLLFPYDFIRFTPQNSNKDSLIYGAYRITALVKKNKIASATFNYLPPKQAEFQMIPYVKLSQEYDKLGIWGRLIDGFSWVDKLGENLVVRSYLQHIDTAKASNHQKTYLYCYQFRRNSETDNWDLTRKVTDVSVGCGNIKHTLLNINTIELTDLNQDSIAEYSFRYILNCNSPDTLISTRLLLLTNNQKFTTTSSYTKKERKQKIYVDFTKTDPLLERYLMHILVDKSKASKG